MVMITWLADVLRQVGLDVVEVEGWKKAGRGDMDDVLGVVIHHTAGARKGNAPSLNVIIKGRADLPGPLSQLFLARDGTFHVVAAGRTNHAGRGKWMGVENGNGEFIGIEAENVGDGTDPWPSAQLDALERGTAAILRFIGADSVMACGHKEYALPKGRKIDPAFDMVAFRNDVEDWLYGDPRITTRTPVVPKTDPKRSMLRKGMNGESVIELQLALDARGFKLTADGNFGPKTEAALKAFQSQNGLVPDGLSGPKTWAVLMKGK